MALYTQLPQQITIDSSIKKCGLFFFLTQSEKRIIKLVWPKLKEDNGVIRGHLSL